MFEWQARTIRRTPWLVLVGVVAATVGLLAGFLVQDVPPAPVDATATFLPADSELAEASAAVRESFPEAAGVEIVQVLARGDVLTADSLRAVGDLQTRIIQDPAVAPFAVSEPLAGYVGIVESVLAANGLDLATVGDAELDAALDRLSRSPELAAARAGLDRFVPRDAAGTPIAGLSLITLNDAGDPLGLQDAQLRAGELAEEASAELAPLAVSVISKANSNIEGKEARESSLFVLMGLALLVMVVLLAAFYRSGSDVVLAIVGLLLTILWTFGAQAWLSPGGAGIVDPENILIVLVPVLLIGLSVDYALQITGRYREALLAEGAAADRPGAAMATAVRSSGVPVLLAAGTTAVSFLTNLTSKFEPVADFGIVAGIGVVSGWIVMTSFVPAARLVADRRRVARDRRPATRAVAETIPGVESFLSRAATTIVRRPLPILGGAVALVILAGIASAGLDTTFALKDFVPRGSDTERDIEFLEDNFDGGAATMTILITDDLDTVRTVRDLFDFYTTLADPQRRPVGVVGPPVNSVGTLLVDWIDDSGAPGDNYDPAFAAAYADLNLNVFAADEEVRAAWALLEGVDPAGFARVVEFRPDGPDRTIFQVPVAVEGVETSRELIADLEALWGGDASEITVTGGDSLIALVTEELTESQVVSVGLTTLAALVILVLYFGLTQFRPALGLITIAPIAVVLVWVLGAMWLLGISYNMVTALITALTIGIGVDYTIHLTHRFLEEERGARRIRDAMRRAMTTTGGALVASALTTALGLLTLLFAPLTPMRQLGLLTAVTILLALIAAFAVLPPLLVLWALYHRWRRQEFTPASHHPSPPG